MSTEWMGGAIVEDNIHKAEVVVAESDLKAVNLLSP